MSNYTTGICFNCGTDDGLHQSETHKCPKNGMELPMHLWNRGERQQWEETVFEDSGLKKIELSAPDMLEALQRCVKFFDKAIANTDDKYESSMVLQAKAAIKKATE